MSNKYDDILNNQKRQDKEIEILAKRLNHLEANQADSEVASLKVQLNDLEQYGRCQNMEIHGLDRRENENLLTVVNELATELYLDRITPSDIDGLHRLPEKRDKPAVILVRFVSPTVKAKWQFKSKEQRQKLGGVRFYDNLTACNKRLLWLTHTKAAEVGYQYTWQSNGKVFTRKQAGDRAIVIKWEQDLGKIR